MTEKTIPIQDDPKFSGLTLSKENEESCNLVLAEKMDDGLTIRDRIEGCRKELKMPDKDIQKGLIEPLVLYSKTYKEHGIT